MYHPGNAGYAPNGQWTQPAPPQGGPPPPPPPVSAEAAAALKNYGYGNVAPPRSGPPGHRGGRNAGLGRGQPEMYPAAGTSYAPGQPMQPTGQQPMGHQPPGGAPYPPAKRAKYDPSAGYMPPPYAGQPYQAQYQAYPPSQPPMGQPQPYYPVQHAPNPAHVGLSQHPYQQHSQMHQPMAQPQYQPPHVHQTQATHSLGSSAPPLAVALMKATPMASGNRGGEKHRPNNQPQYNANLPPPPTSAPPPPPPSEPVIPSGPKGLASLPVRPVSVSTSSAPPTPATAASATTPSMPPTSGIPTGPAAHNTTIQRNTRPLPSQSLHVKANLRGSEGSSRGGSAGGNRGRGVPTGPRGGRGGGRGGRSGFEGPRGPNRQQNQNQNQHNRRDDRFDQSQQNSEKGYKRTFSQTGPPAHSPRGPATRPRTNSNATATSSSIPTGPKKGQALNTKKRDRTKEGSPAPSTPSNSKSLKRTLTDFRIDSLEIPALNWTWKATPLSQILAQMNLKETEDVSTKKEKEFEPKVGHAAIAPTDTEKHPEVQDRSEELSDATAKVEELGTSTPVSADLQRSDSRPEKRKHARDEEEEEEEERLRQVASEEAKEPVIYPVGKKVRSERAPDILDEASSAAAIPALPTRAEASDEDVAEVVPTSEAVPNLDSTLAVEEVSPTAGDAEIEQSDNDSESSDSSEEVADSIIANRPQEEKLEGDDTVTPMPEDQQPLADTSIKVEEDQVDLQHSKAANESSVKERVPIKSVPKKFWENSRLRIYFMSPVELEQKDVRQTLLRQKGKATGTPAPAETKDADRKASVETVTSKTAAVANETASLLEATTTDTRSDKIESASVSETPDDLDGEPLSSAEQEALSTVSVAAVEGDEAASTKAPQAPEPAHALQVVNGAEAAEDESIDTRRQLSSPSADRLSIAYAQNTRRLVIDAEVIDEVVLHRAEGKIEISVKLEAPTTEEEGLGFRCAKGVYIEKSISPSEQNYEEIGADELSKSWDVNESAGPTGALDGEESSSSDHLSPPLHRLLVQEAESSTASLAAGEEGSQRCTIIAKMDRAHPLTEAKWVRTGNPDDWILSVLGNGSNGSHSSNNNAGGRAAQQLPKGEQQGNNNSPNTQDSNIKNSKDVVRGSAWKGKIRVVDPDAPPTFQHALENWLSSANTRNGFDEARYRFVNTHFQDIDNVLEVLLRLIRGSSGSGSGANASSSNTTDSSNNNAQSTNLATQSKLAKAPYPEYQTPISLATFQLFRLSIDSLTHNASDNNNTGNGNSEINSKKKDLDRKIGEIIRNLPYSLIFKSLDSMFSDFKRGNVG